MAASERVQHSIRVALATLALLYALFAGLRAVSDTDLGWHLATARYIVANRQVPSSDVLSYTAPGQPFVYPPASMLALYGLHNLGGYTALSWFGALCCLATVALVLTGGAFRLPVIFLAIVAVPLIAARTTPRADMFSTVLTAAVLWPLWRFHRGERARLWLLPLFLFAWVNLHLGFLTGVGLMSAYLLFEASDFAQAEKRAAARERLRQAWPWLALAAAATFVNPWTYGIYQAFIRQNSIMKGVGNRFGEWSGVQARQGLVEFAAWRAPDSAFWWLLAAAVAGVIAAIWLRQSGAACVLVAGMVVSWQHVRLQVVFAILVAVVVGTLLYDLFTRLPRTRAALAATLVVTVAAAALVAVRVSDLTSNRYYLAAGEISLFGPGESWWFPERAAEFLLHEQLPANVFEGYNLGGFLGWKLGPRYPVYLDGRAVPFGPAIFFRAAALEPQPLDSVEWQQEADRRGINTVFFSTARYLGLGGYPLRADCESKSWTPVYLDEVAVVFVRNRPENASWTDRLRIDCTTVPFDPPRNASAVHLYNFYANAGSVLYVLERDREAADAFERARRIFAYDPNLYLGMGQLLQSNGQANEAEAAYRHSLQLKQTASAWYALGRLYLAGKRYDEAAHAIERSAELSFAPGERYRELAEIYLDMKRPDEALRALDQAAKWNPYGSEAGAARERFLSRLAVLRARAGRER